MKPFITDAIKNGRFILNFQCEGGNLEKIRKTIENSCVTAYAMPEGHSLKNAWLFRMYFNNHYFIEFSSACTEVIGWQEVGSLNMRLALANEKEDQVSFFKAEIENFFVKTIEALVYEDTNVYSECGIVFCSPSGKEIIVAAGVSPGSVSISTPFSKEEFDPEFSEGAYQRKAI